VVAKKDGIVVWHHGWRLLVSGAGAQSVLSLVCLVQQSSGVQGRLESSVQYGNYFYIAIILFWLEMRWYVNGNQL